jgi:hypothetical protein
VKCLPDYGIVHRDLKYVVPPLYHIIPTFPIVGAYFERVIAAVECEYNPFVQPWRKTLA